MSERRRTWGPCPACNATQRGSEDGRGPIGVSASGGWTCHAGSCGAKGDVVTALCWHLTRSESPSEDGWKQVRDYAAERGWCSSKGNAVTDRVRHMGGGSRAPTPARPKEPKELSEDDIQADGPSGAADDGAESDATTAGYESRGGMFKWSSDLVERCHEAYLNPEKLIGSGAWSDRDVGLALSVVRYLIEYRRLTEDVLRFARIGIYVDAGGKLVLDEGRPWLVIPLYDKAGRAVSAHFRRVPVPGTCADCDALGEWKECDPCRKKKRYRLCTKRPTPLYGANHLTGDTREPVYIVEGELDVLALRVYGFTENVVSGTAGADTFVTKEDWLNAIEPYDTFYLAYDDDKAGNDGAATLAEKLGADRCSRVRFPHKDVGDCLIQGVPTDQIQRAFSTAEPLVEVKFRKASSFLDQILALRSDPNMGRGTPTGSATLDGALAGWRPGVIVVTGDTGAGKAQPVDEVVLTPAGFVPIGSIKVGDEVVTVTGEPTRVLGVFPQGERDVAVVRFSDGAEVRCDWDHLWTVTTDLCESRGEPWRTLNTKDIADSIRAPDGRARWRIPTISRPCGGMDEGMPVDPYVLGVLIGDGSLTNGVRFSSADPEIVNEVAKRLPAGLTLHTRTSKSKASDCWISGGSRGAPSGSEPNHILNGLRDLGLLGCRAEHKFIPKSYLSSSQQARASLLGGLLDTDGYVSKRGCVQYGTSSKALAMDVIDLVRSLGGIATLSSKTPMYVYKGQQRIGLEHFTVGVSIPSDILRDSMMLRRKTDRLADIRITPRKIVSVEPAGRAECVCIAVEHPSHLYVTRDYVVTHNTTFLTWALWNLATRGHPVAITSFEQTPAGSVQKLIRMQLEDDYTKVSEEAVRRAGAELDAMPLYIVDHYGHLPFSKLQESLKYASRRLGVKHILVDHLGFLVDSEADDERRAIEAIVRSLVIVAKNLGITIFLVVHPRNDPDQKTFSRVTMKHLKGASAIRQDADDVLVVTAEPPNTERGRLLGKGKRRPWPQMRLYIDKKRSEFGSVPPGGGIALAFDPVSLHYADTWGETPLGRKGVLFDTLPPAEQEEEDGAPPSKSGGKKKQATGRQKSGSRTSNASNDDSNDPDPFDTDV